ncbi:MAG: sensor histidine kinase [Pirellulales bacterium]
MQVALRAVIDNGLNELRPGGSVEVELRTLDDATAEIEVRDDGPGIPAAVREHLFDPFFSGREAGAASGWGSRKLGGSSPIMAGRSASTRRPSAARRLSCEFRDKPSVQN